MRTLLLLLTGCNIGLQTVPSLSDSGYPTLDDSGTPDDTDDTQTDGDCVDADSDGVDTCSGDCDDSDSNTWPGAAEADSATACMTDADGDGYGSDSPASGVTAGTDCNDANSNLSPGQPETPFDGVDSNCDGADGGSVVTASGQGNVPIMDNSTASSTATVSGCSEVYDIIVTVNIVHTYIGDLLVTLNAPGGQSIVLHNRWLADLRPVPRPAAGCLRQRPVATDGQRQRQRRHRDDQLLGSGAGVPVRARASATRPPATIS